MTENTPGTSRVLRNAGLLVILLPASLMLSVLAAIILARSLGPTARGVVAAATAGPTIAALLVFLGFGVSNAYFVARGEVEVARALGTSLAAALGAGLLAGLLYVGVALLLRTSVLHGLPVAYIALGGLMVPLLLAVRWVTTVAIGLERAMLINSVAIVRAGSLVALYTLLLVILHGGPLVAFLVSLIALLLALVPLLAILWRTHGRWRFERAYLVRGIRFGAKGEAGNVVTFLVYRADLLVVTALLGFTAAGQYTIAFTGVELLWVVPGAIATALLPRVAASSLEGPGHSVEITSQVARLTTLLLGIFSLVGAILAPFLIPVVFSAEYRASILPLEILIPGAMIYGVGKVLSADLTGRGRPGVVTAASALGLVVMLALDFALIPTMGLVGAALACSIAYALVFMLQLRIFTRLTGASASSLILTRGGDLVYARARLLGLARRLRGSVRRPTS